MDSRELRILADALKRSHLDERYGPGAGAAYFELVKEQEGHCAICDRSETELGEPLKVDHSHSTGNVRGLLCSNCNSLLGFAHDDPLVLTAAMIYLWERK